MNNDSILDGWIGGWMDQKMDGWIDLVILRRKKLKLYLYIICRLIWIFS